jgi:hypothetical protein
MHGLCKSGISPAETAESELLEMQLMCDIMGSVDTPNKRVLDVFHLQVVIIRVIRFRVAASVWSNVLVFDVLVLARHWLARHVQHGLVLGLQSPIVGSGTSLDQLAVLAEHLLEIGLWLVEILLEALGGPEAILAELLDNEIGQYMLVDTSSLELLRLVLLLRNQVQKVFGSSVDANAISGALGLHNLEGFGLCLEGNLGLFLLYAEILFGFSGTAMELVGKEGGVCGMFCCGLAKSNGIGIEMELTWDCARPPPPRLVDF